MRPCEFCGTSIPLVNENSGTDLSKLYYLVDWNVYTVVSSRVCLSCAISNRDMSLSPSSEYDVKTFLGE